MKEPFEPATTICFTLFCSFKERCADVPEVSRALFKTLLTSASNDSRKVKPGKQLRRFSRA